jgi:predicted phage terminase large subunit-like protein
MASNEDSKHYLIHQIRRKMGFVETAKEIASYAKSLGHPNILIEKAANGFAVIDILREAGFENIHTFSAGKNSKEQRASTVAYLLDRGDVRFPRTAPAWFEEYVRELTGFPSMRHDDQVDATTMYLAWVTGNQTIDLAAAFRFAGKMAGQL